MASLRLALPALCAVLTSFACLAACGSDGPTTGTAPPSGGSAGTQAAGSGGASAGSGGTGTAGAPGAASGSGGSAEGGTGGLLGDAGAAGEGGAGGEGGEAGAIEPPVKACTAPAYALGRHSLELDVAGTKRQFLLYVPKGYQGKARVPLVFNLHPSGGNPAGHENDTKMDTFADQHGFVVAALAGVGNVWNVARDPKKPDDVAFAEKVLEFAAQKLCIDDKRVYATGFSGGARTSSRFACAMPSRIAAIAPVAGLRNDPPCDVHGIDVLTVHGTADATNFYNGCAVTDTTCSRNGEWVEGIEPAVSDWVTANGCNKTAKVDDLGSGVSRRSYLDCTTGSVVVFYRVTNGTHTWHQLADTSKVVVDFLMSH